MPVREPWNFECLLVSHKGNPMDRGAWLAAVHGVVESRTWLSDFTFTFLFHALKEMASHSSVLAWRIPGTEEPRGLLSMESHRVGHDWSDLAAARSQKVTLGSSAFSRPEYLGRTNIIMICSCFKYFPEKKFISTTHIFSRTIDNLHTYNSSPVF